MYVLHSSCCNKCINIITQHKIIYLYVTSLCPLLMLDNNKESTIHTQQIQNTLHGRLGNPGCDK